MLDSNHQPLLLPRREFVKGLSLLGAATLLSPLLPGCFAGNGESSQGPKTRVSLIKTTNRTEGVKRAIDLLEDNHVQGKSVVIKPNFNSGEPAPCSTHMDTLRALVDNLNEMGATGITVAERSGPGNVTQTVFEKLGVQALAEEMGFELLNMQEMDEEGWVKVHPPDSHWPDGFLFPRIYTDAESIVQTCLLKTHSYGGHFTMSLKNSVGLIPVDSQYTTAMHTSEFMRQMIAEINTAYTTDLVMLDGVEAFVDGGPAMGTLAKPGVMLAGNDRVAIDAVGVAILRDLGTTPEVSQGRVFEQDQIARAAELGIGVASADEIDIVSDDAVGEAYAARIRDILDA